MKRTSSTTTSAPFAGLTFAVYARKSSEDTRHENHTSTARQVDHATRYVEQRGGMILTDCIFTDEATSGTEFEQRPRLLRFLNALGNGRPFNALVMMDDDRLGRDQYRLNYLLQQIVDKGVRIFTYIDGGREILLDTETAKFMQSVRSFGAALEREKARQRARDAAERKARLGHVTGNEPFGYENVYIKDGNEVPRGKTHEYVVRRIREDQAKTVRQIFTMYADGYGMVQIAKTMNAVPQYATENRKFFGGRPVPPPRDRSRSWSPGTIREMLHCRAYHGEIVWGETTHIDKNGRAGVAVRADDGRRVVVPAPHLKIVPDSLWKAVHDRLAVRRDTFLRDWRGKLWAKPDQGRTGRYLLTNLATCTVCGGKIVVWRATPRKYGCAHYHRRWTCTNGLIQPVAAVDEAFLGALHREVLTPQRFTVALRAGVDQVRREVAKDPDRRAALEKEKATVTGKIQRMVAAIGDGQGPKTLVAEIAKGEGRVAEIEAEVVRLAAGSALTAGDLKRIESEIAGQLTRFTDLLRGNIPRARQALKKLLVTEVEFTPVRDGKGRPTYAFRAELAYGAIVEQVVYTTKFPDWTTSV